MTNLSLILQSIQALWTQALGVLAGMGLDRYRSAGIPVD